MHLDNLAQGQGSFGPGGGGSSGSGSGGGPVDPCLGPPVLAGGAWNGLPAVDVRNGVTYDLYVRQVSCDPSVAGAVAFYLRRVTLAEVTAGLRERVEALIPLPEASFQPMDPKGRWTFVNVPVDFRVVSPLEPVSLSSSLSNGVVTVSASLTATPERVVFSPGEPKGVDAGCSAAGATAPYVIKTPGECAYQYRNSSAIAANGRTFSTSMTVEWSMELVSSQGTSTLDSFAVTSTRELAVAEVQALVTCTGPLPEQGGC